jgi:hypothetical protein
MDELLSGLFDPWLGDGRARSVERHVPADARDGDLERDDDPRRHDGTSRRAALSIE